MRQSLDDRRGGALQQIGDLHRDPALLKTHMAVGVGEGLELNFDRRDRGGGPDLPVYPLEDRLMVFEKERTRDVHR